MLAGSLAMATGGCFGVDGELTLFGFVFGVLLAVGINKLEVLLLLCFGTCFKLLLLLMLMLLLALQLLIFSANKLNGFDLDELILVSTGCWGDAIFGLECVLVLFVLLVLEVLEEDEAALRLPSMDLSMIRIECDLAD